MRVPITKRVINTEVSASARYHTVEGLGLTPGTWQIIALNGTAYYRDGVRMSATDPYTTHGIPVPRDATDVFVEFVKDGRFSMYVPAGVVVSLRLVE